MTAASVGQTNMTKKCLFLGTDCTGKASSKEHVINNSRRIFIQKRGAELGNDKARFRGITCQKCNRFLGGIEENTWSGLAVATLWKVLAGNLNRVFDRASWAQVHSTDDGTLEHYLAILRDALLKEEVFPDNMLGYELSFTATTGADGMASMSILTDAEGIRVFRDFTHVENKDNGEKFSIETDFLLYHSHRSHGHRMLFFMPLIQQPLKTPWEHATVKVSHSGFGVYVKQYLERSLGVECKLYKLFDNAQQGVPADR